MYSLIAILFIAGFLFSNMLLLSIVSDMRNIAKIFIIIVFFLALALNVYLYIFTIDPEFLIYVGYPISMSIGFFMGMLFFVFIYKKIKEDHLCVEEIKL